VKSEWLPESHHVHRCPVCWKERACFCEDDPALELSTGAMMSYKTCKQCIEKLHQQSNYDVIPVAAGAAIVDSRVLWGRLRVRS